MPSWTFLPSCRQRQLILSGVAKIASSGPTVEVKKGRMRFSSWNVNLNEQTGQNLQLVLSGVAKIASSGLTVEVKKGRMRFSFWNVNLNKQTGQNLQLLLSGVAKIDSSGSTVEVKKGRMRFFFWKFNRESRIVNAFRIMNHESWTYFESRIVNRKTRIVTKN